MTTHPITGVSTLNIAGDTRTLACDMNCAALLFEQHGENWPSWVTERFLGISVDGGRELKPLSPADMISTLYALLASDRIDTPRPHESIGHLGRSIGIGEYSDLQLSLIRCVMTAFGVPGKFVDDVLAAVNARPKTTSAPLAPGTGATSAPSPLALSASSLTASGASPSPSGTVSSKATLAGSKPSARKRPGRSHT